ncbi:MAG: hypothetical protein RL385_4859 [Pseudomonadota bacterium]
MGQECKDHPVRKVLAGAAMTKQEAQRSIDILAKSVYRDLKVQGFERAEILAFASNILAHVTDEARARRESKDETTA